MNKLEPRDRTAFAAQEPYRAPWFAICMFIGLVAFVAGHFLWRAHGGDLIQNSHIVDALHDQPASVSAKDIIDNTRHPVPASAASAIPLSSNPIADIVSSVGPTVVSIDTTIKEHRHTITVPDFLFSKPGKASTSSSHDSTNTETYEAHGAGSGIIVRSDGYIMTNYHVVKGAQDIKITLTDGRVFPGHVVGHDSYTDVALVKVDASGLPVAKLGSSRAVRPGDWAIAIGSPLGLSHTVTMGIVSAVGRSLADLNNNVDLIQTDAAINPGNSGGPLLNIKGEVVGINMAIRTDAQNIGFTIPIDVAREAATAIMDHRALARPYLGLSMVDYDPELAESIGLPGGQHGAMVSKVVEESPAAASGIAEGDLIESVDNTPVKGGGDVQRIVRHYKVGSKVHLQVLHAGKLESLNVKLMAYPQDGIS